MRHDHFLTKSFTLTEKITSAKIYENGIPFCPTTANKVPQALVSYTEARAIHNRQMRRGNKNFFVNSFVHFYQHDYKFDGSRCGIWVALERAAKIFRHFAGIITPDFSTYLDFPFILSAGVSTVYRKTVSLTLGRLRAGLTSLRIENFSRAALKNFSNY